MLTVHHRSHFDAADGGTSYSEGHLPPSLKVEGPLRMSMKLRYLWLFVC